MRSTTAGPNRRRAPKPRRCPRCHRDVSVVRDYLKPGTWRLATHGPGPDGVVVCGAKATA